MFAGSLELAWTFTCGPPMLFFTGWSRMYSKLINIPSISLIPILLKIPLHDSSFAKEFHISTNFGSVGPVPNIAKSVANSSYNSAPSKSCK